MTSNVHWETVEIESICKIVRGSSPRPKGDPRYYGGPIPRLMVEDLTRDGKLAYPCIDSLTVEGAAQSRPVPAGTVVMVVSGQVGRVARVAVDACIHDGFVGFLDLDISRVDPNYLIYCLENDKAQFEKNVAGAIWQNLTTAQIKKMRIPLPPLAEQKRIAAILDQADALRGKRRAALARLDALVQSLFLEMFGDPVANPMGWTVQPLEELADITSGVTKGRKFGDKETVTVPYMRVANVQDGVIDTSDIKSIEVLPSDIEKYQLRAGDILLTEGGDPDKLGRGAVWKGEIFPCIHQNHIFRVRLTSNALLPEYLSALISSKRGKLYFLRAAKQTTGIATINKTQLASFPTLLPHYDLQKKYLQAMENIGMLRKRVLSHLTHTDNLFQALQQRAFRGDL